MSNAQGQLHKSDNFIRSLSGRFIVTSVFSVFAVYAGSMIDTMFIGLFLGEEGLMAISLVGPVYLLYYTIGSVIGIGGANAAGVFLGKRDYNGYRIIFTVSTILLLLICLPITVIGFLVVNPLAHMLGGTGETANQMVQYLLYYIPGGAFTMLAYIPLYFLKIDGRPKSSSVLFLLSAAINIMLTALFMSPLCNMGIGGAAFATTISMGVTAAIGFWLLLTGKSELHFVKCSFSVKVISRIFSVGLPHGFTNLLESVRILLINFLLIKLGAAIFLPTFTVVRNVIELASSVMFGLSGALIPLVGIFYGERDYVNLKSSFKYAIKVGLYIMIPITVAVCCLSDGISALFSVTSPLILAENRIALPLACIGLIAAYLNIMYVGYCSIVKHTWLANLMVFMRLALYLALFAVLLGNFMGTSGIWLSFTIAEVATLLSYFGIRWLLKKRKPGLDSYLISETDRHAVDISFSVLTQAEDIVLASEKISEFCEQNDITMQKAMMVGLTIEEMLSIIILHCTDEKKVKSVDVRVCKLENEVVVRLRHTGEIFNPIQYYEDNENDDELAVDLLGLRMIISEASLIDYQQTFGVNNLLITF